MNWFAGCVYQYVSLFVNMVIAAVHSTKFSRFVHVPYLSGLRRSCPGV